MTARAFAALVVSGLLVASQGDTGLRARHVLALVSGGRVAWSSPVRTGEAFTLSFEHSAETPDGYTLAAFRLFDDIHMRNSLRAGIVLSVGDQWVDVSRLFDDFQPFTLELR
jgi:hypothetical protein